MISAALRLRANFMVTGSASGTSVPRISSSCQLQRATASVAGQGQRRPGPANVGARRAGAEPWARSEVPVAQGDLYVHNTDWFGVISGRTGYSLERIYYRWIRDYRYGRNW